MVEAPAEVDRGAPPRHCQAGGVDRPSRREPFGLEDRPGFVLGDGHAEDARQGRGILQRLKVLRGVYAHHIAQRSDDGVMHVATPHQAAVQQEGKHLRAARGIDGHTGHRAAIALVEHDAQPAQAGEATKDLEQARHEGKLYVMSTFLSIARNVVFVAFATAAVVATASWLVRTHRVSPFGGFGGFLRRVSDPLMRPVEARVVRMGGHPAQASFWLVIGTAVAGILLLWTLQFAVDLIQDLRATAGGGVRALAAFAVGFAYRIVVIALVIRVVAGWFGHGRYNRWIRPAYLLTDWIVEPLRRVVPTLGAIDVTPLVAWLVLWLLMRFVYAVLL